MLDVPVHVTLSTSIAEWMTAFGTVGAAVATLLAVLVALFGRDVWERRHRPTLEIDYQPREPYCRDTSLESGARAHWVRIRVRNKGRGTAKRCKGKMIGVYRTDSSLREDRDPMVLKWAGMPKGQDLQPLDLARDESQYLAVVVATDDNREVVSIVTDAEARPGFPQTLEAGEVHWVRLGVYADNAEPIIADFEITFNGDIHSLEMAPL